MPARHDRIDPRPRASRLEVARLIRQIQALVTELDSLRRRGGREGAVRARERRLEGLRWRLAAASRRAALEDLGSLA